MMDNSTFDTVIYAILLPARYHTNVIVECTASQPASAATVVSPPNGGWVYEVAYYMHLSSQMSDISIVSVVLELY